MDLHESNTSGATGKKRGTSGWVKPKYYSKHREWLGKVCEKTTGYTLTDYADNIEATIMSNDYRTLYKHFYSADADGNLKDTVEKDKDTESTGDDGDSINELFFSSKKEYSKYKANHKVRSGTEIEIGDDGDDSEDKKDDGSEDEEEKDAEEKLGRIAKIKKGVVRFAKGLRDETEETVQAVGILAKHVSRKEVSDEEKEFMGNQFKDTVRMTALGAVGALPLGSALIPILVKVAGKVGVELKPSAFRDEPEND